MTRWVDPRASAPRDNDGTTAHSSTTRTKIRETRLGPPLWVGGLAAKPRALLPRCGCRSTIPPLTPPIRWALFPWHWSIAIEDHLLLPAWGRLSATMEVSGGAARSHEALPEHNWALHPPAPTPPPIFPSSMIDLSRPRQSQASPSVSFGAPFLLPLSEPPPLPPSPPPLPPLVAALAAASAAAATA